MMLIKTSRRCSARTLRFESFNRVGDNFVSFESCRSKQSSREFLKVSTTSIDFSLATQTDVTTMFIRRTPALDSILLTTTLQVTTITTTLTSHHQITTMWWSHTCNSLKARTDHCSGASQQLIDILRQMIICIEEVKLIKRLPKDQRVRNRHPNRPPKNGKVVSHKRTISFIIE